MKTVSEKTTIYLNPKIKKSVQHYALRDSLSLSAIINDRLFEYLEDMADTSALNEAHKSNEEYVSFERFVDDLELDFNEIRSKAQHERQKTTKKTR